MKILRRLTKNTDKTDAVAAASMLICLAASRLAVSSPSFSSYLLPSSPPHVSNLKSLLSCVNLPILSLCLLHTK